MTLAIEKQEVQKILSTYRGSALLQTALEESSEQEVVSLLIKYVYFNRLFGASVAHLASRFATQTELFRDVEESSSLWNDRSMDIASSIFAAAIDEFGKFKNGDRDGDGDGDLAEHPTHRMLAQAVVKGLAEYSGMAPDQLSEGVEYIKTTIDPQVCRGYGSMAQHEKDLFRALGFHLGSELLADQEFRTIDTILRKDHSQLVRHLESTSVSVSGVEVLAYRWIGIHTSVEIDHFYHAVRAANGALQYYSGAQNKSEVKEQILEGINQFAAFQQRVMEYFSASSHSTPELQK